MKYVRIVQVAGVATLGVAGWLVFVSPALAQTATDTTTTPVDVNALLAPMLFAATAVERVLEMAWNFFENSAQQAAAALGLGSDWARYAHAQVSTAEANLRDLSRQLAPPPPVRPAGGPTAPSAPGAVPPPAPPVATRPSLDALMTAAQRDLINAQANLRSALESDRYKSIKQAISVLAGLAIGIFLAVSTGLDMFKLLNIAHTASLFGELVTGLIIGAGTGPVHSIIGLLQQTRDAVDQAANLFNSRAAQNNARTFTNPTGATDVAPTPASALEGAAPFGAEAAPATPALPTAADALAIKQLARR